MGLLSRKSQEAVSKVSKKESVISTESVIEGAVIPMEKPEDVIGPVRIQKDTLLARDVRLSGEIEGQGNISLEGSVEGNLRCFHQVRVAAGGHVMGDIHARIVMINGRVEGRLYADTVILQAEGAVKGDIYTDELIIEKGGFFTGLSQRKSRDEKSEQDVPVTRLNVRPYKQDVVVK